MEGKTHVKVRGKGSFKEGKWSPRIRWLPELSKIRISWVKNFFGLKKI